ARGSRGGRSLRLTPNSRVEEPRPIDRRTVPPWKIASKPALEGSAEGLSAENRDSQNSCSMRPTLSSHLHFVYVRDSPSNLAPVLRGQFQIEFAADAWLFASLVSKS